MGDGVVASSDPFAPAMAVTVYVLMANVASIVQSAVTGPDV